MNVVRRLSLLATAGLLCIAVMLGWVSARPSISADSAAQITSSLAWFDSTIVLARNARPVGARGDALAIAVGYLERERLGLGSPFQLVDEALHDPRLDSAMSNRVAWALLGRLRRGDAYQIDASVLDGAGPWSRDGHGALGANHLALIERTIAAAPDPRAGELAVRLAYAIAAGKGSVASNAPQIATDVAALVRDRALAAADLRDLLADAAERHDDALSLLGDRRASRAFRVEQPALAPLTSRERVDAMNAVPSVLSALDTLDRTATAVTAHAPATLLGPAFANRLATLGARQPTISQVWITLRARPQAALHATNDETLAAGFAAAASAPDSVRRAPALAVLSSAIALRAFNQESPWFTGDQGPTAADLRAEFGLGEVTFARTIPSPWRPYYLRELANSLRDMQGVFPALTVAGLNVSFGTAELPDSALAMHDPRSRTLKLTINSSGGTLAHELSHDLDWQTARRIFTAGGGYSTDRAMREHRGALATSVRGLAEARLLRPIPAGATTAITDRPAELFARGTDWFVATSLALGGRTNGFLTAVQDGAISGYAAGAPTAVGHAGVASLIAALDQMTFIADSLQTGFEALWSDPATIDPLLLVRRVFATPIPRGAFGARPGALALSPGAVSFCTDDSSEEGGARSRLVAAAIGARAHGVVMRRARYRFSGARPEWANGLTGVAPWNPDAADGAVASVASALVTELRNATADQGVVPAVPASFRSINASCAAIAR